MGNHIKAATEQVALSGGSSFIFYFNYFFIFLRFYLSIYFYFSISFFSFLFAWVIMVRAFSLFFFFRFFLLFGGVVLFLVCLYYVLWLVDFPFILIYFLSYSAIFTIIIAYCIVL